MPEDNNNDIIQPMNQIPENWHDEEGRVFKNKLIDGFNTIEAKINEIAALDIDNFTIPDISTTVYPNVSLSDAGKDNYVLNLRSFLNIVELIGFPLNIETDGNIKITRVEYWGPDYKYHVLRNTDEVVPDSTDKFIYLNYENNEIIKSDSSTTPALCSLIGCLVNNKLYTMNSRFECPIDMLSVLCNENSNRSYTSIQPNEYGDNGDHKWIGNKTFKEGVQTMICCDKERLTGSGTGKMINLGLHL